ncbi:MAG: right-handed parallel beta-helix repeat-containing protein [Tannerella sp.]|jgi:hypothetical protein|nr:right-handed parallel beta-helix repeat-containing protein [Tannerella sp.]
MKTKLCSILLLACILFACHAPENRQIRVIDLSGYPLDDYKDDITPLIYQILSEEGTKKNIKIVFPKGIYHFRPERAYGQYHAMTNHDNGYYRIAFPLIDFENLEIDGQNSEFIFHGKIIPFVVERSENIRLKNVVIDWEYPFYLQCHIIASNTQTGEVEVEIPEGFHYTFHNERLSIAGEGWSEPELGNNIVFDAGTKAIAYRTNLYTIHYPYSSDIRATDLGNRRFRLKTTFEEKAPPAGMILTFKGERNNRHSPAIHVIDSKQFRADSVTVHHCGGMALIAEKSENIYINRLNVALREGSNRIVTATADATHFCNCKGEVVVENCLFENMLDDATNMHGTYMKVEEVVDDYTVIARLGHFQQYGYRWGAPGDRIQVISKDTLLPKGNTEIKTFTPVNDQYFRITFNTKVKGLIEVGDGVENMSWYATFTFRNNRVRNNRARSILLSVPKAILIENNTFSSQMAGILFEGDMHGWFESGAVREVIIRGNTFLDGAYGDADFPTIFINPRQEVILPEKPYEQNIVIENNVFKTFNAALVRGHSVDGFVFRNNTIADSDTYTPWTEHPTIELNSSKNIVVEANNYKRKKPFEVKIDGNTRNYSDNIK